MAESTERVKIWRRFCKNIPALASLVIISVSFLVSVLAYVIAPDNSPDANAQFPRDQPHSSTPTEICEPGRTSPFDKSIRVTLTAANKLPR